MRVQRSLAAMVLCLMSFSIIANPSVNTLYTFNASGADGANPEAPLVQDAAGNLYGTAAEGGTSGEGTVFQLSPTGVLTTLHAFSARVDTGLQFPTNTDGGRPSALVLDASGILYGAASRGGTGATGTIFRISGGVFTTLHSFSPLSSTSLTNADGWGPNGLILASDGNLYGTTNVGGSYGSGTVFRISPAGDFAVLYSFSAQDLNLPQANADGANPGSLVYVAGADLYGVTTNGGVAGLGTVFRLTTGGVLTPLYAFGTCASCKGQNLDGAYPNGLLLARDGNLYGTTPATMFRMSPTGVFTSLYSFTSGDGSPTAALVEGADGVFFGTSLIRTTSSTGGAFIISIFSIKAAGTPTQLYSFPQNVASQTSPSLLPATSPGTFYGLYPPTGNNDGVVYALTLGAPLGSAAMPVFMPAAGTYPSGQIVTISEASAGTTIYYTTDGSTPTTAASQISTGGQIQLTTRTTLRAIAAGGGYDSSQGAAASYAISTPGSPSSGGGGGGGSFDGWGLFVLGLLATLRGLARIL
jgi:uncharacterized repeat protein (TIGR03803 family)